MSLFKMEFFNKTFQNINDKLFLIHFTIKRKFKQLENVSLFTIWFPILDYTTHVSMSIQDDLLEVLQVRIVDESPQIGSVWRRN